MNDPFLMEAGKVPCPSNNAGGILGGISTGLDIVYRAAVKPIPP
jgi:chorismate synthase